MIFFSSFYRLRRTSKPNLENERHRENSLRLWIQEAKNTAPKRRSVTVFLSSLCFYFEIEEKKRQMACRNIPVSRKLHPGPALTIFRRAVDLQAHPVPSRRNCLMSRSDRRRISPVCTQNSHLGNLIGRANQYRLSFPDFYPVTRPGWHTFGHTFQLKPFSSQFR